MIASLTQRRSYLLHFRDDGKRLWFPGSLIKSDFMSSVNSKKLFEIQITFQKPFPIGLKSIVMYATLVRTCLSMS